MFFALKEMCLSAVQSGCEMGLGPLKPGCCQSGSWGMRRLGAGQLPSEGCSFSLPRAVRPGHRGRTAVVECLEWPLKASRLCFSQQGCPPCSVCPAVEIVVELSKMLVCLALKGKVSGREGGRGRRAEEGSYL